MFKPTVALPAIYMFQLYILEDYLHTFVGYPVKDILAARPRGIILGIMWGEKSSTLDVRGTVEIIGTLRTPASMPALYFILSWKTRNSVLGHDSANAIGCTRLGMTWVNEMMV